MLKSNTSVKDKQGQHSLTKKQREDEIHKLCSHPDAERDGYQWFCKDCGETYDD